MQTVFLKTALKKHKLNLFLQHDCDSYRKFPHGSRNEQRYAPLFFFRETKFPRH